jgi:spermidine synthase
MTKNWFKETLHKDWQQQLEMLDVIYRDDNNLQSLVIFENKTFGRVLALDGVVQLTEKDEFIYHEMFAHVPILAHGAVKHVLIIGGGDGGLLREVLRYKTIESVDIIEIDESVVTMCKKYFPMVEQGAFSDSRVTLHINDGAKYISQTSNTYDLILVDSTDPVGPAVCLFESPFYQSCLTALKEGGALITQNGSTFSQTQELVTTFQRMKHLTDLHGFYLSVVPTYIGGAMSHAWASNDFNLQAVSMDSITARLEASQLKMRYYNPAIHQSAFAIPQYILNQCQKGEQIDA